MFKVICVHACMRNKYHAGVNLYEMSTYKSCWRWSVSQFSTCMSLFRHGCQRQSFWNSHIDSQMYTFLDQMNWQFDQVLMDSKFQSKLRVLDTDDVKQKTSLFFVQGKSAWYQWFFFFCFMSSESGTQNKCSKSHHSYPLHPIITWIYGECKVQDGLIL